MDSFTAVTIIFCFPENVDLDSNEYLYIIYKYISSYQEQYT